MKRALTALILCALICQTLASCGETTADPKDSSPDSTETSVEEAPSASDVRAATKDSLPDDLDFGGETFRILSRSDPAFLVEMYAEEQSAEPVNDAVYNRNRSVEQRLNVVLDVQPLVTGAETTPITKAVASGDDVYGLCLAYSWSVPELVLGGNFLNLHNVKYLDFEQPWWVWNLNKELTVYGKQYFMAGDLTLSLLQQECCMFYNQKLWEDYNLEDPYALVKNGGWTIDKLTELTKNVTKDLDGNGELDLEDLYGIGYSNTVYMMATGYGAGMRFTSRNSDDLPEICFPDERTYNIFDKYKTLVGQNSTFKGYSYYSKMKVEEVMQKQIEMFVSDRLLIDTGSYIDAEQFRDMKSDFGILPFPKYDVSQEKYYSVSHDSFSLAAIPATCQNTDLAGAVIEAIAAESYRTVTPVYYDKVMKNKYSRDTASAEMIDLIHSSITFDFGLINSRTMGYISHTFQNAIEGGQELASNWATKEKNAKAGLEKLLKAYKELDH